MERKIHSPRDVEDSINAPLAEEEAGSKVRVAEAEPLSEYELTLMERSEQLQKIASKAMRADKLDRDASRSQGLGIYFPASITGATNSLLSFADMEIWPAYVNMPILAAAGGFQLANILRMGDMTLEIPEGNTIQCLRIAQHTDAVRDGKVLFAVHPRGFGVGEGAAEKSRQSLADALEVIGLAHTSTQKKDRYGGVVMAASAARHAGLHVTGSRPYQEVIQGITEEPPHVPYDESAVILPMESLAGIVERLRQNPDATIGKVLEEIARHHPGMKKDLTADNPALLKALHGVLQRIAYSEGRQVRWENEMETVGTQEVWTGARYKVAEDVVPMLDTKDPYNPRMIFRSAQTGQERSNQDLRSMTGGELVMASLMQQLDSGEIDDLKLVRMALELLGTRNGSPEANKATNEEAAADAKTDPNQDPQLITLGKDVDKWKHRRRHITRLALGAAALFTAGQAALWGLSAGSANEGHSNARETDAVQLYRVENHGLTQRSPYWAQETGYTFKDGQWITATQNRTELELPTRLQTDMPHLTIKTTMSSEDLSLPIEEDMKLAALRVYDSHRDAVDVKTYRSADGVVMVDGNETTEGTYLEYDLVTGKGPSVHANQPVTVEGEMRRSYGWQETFQDAADSARYVRDTYIYDDSQAIKDQLAHTHSPTEYSDHIMETQRCQCLQCNAHVALMESQVRPKQKLAIVGGFLHYRRPETLHSYLVESHAWLNDGKTIDATATKKDLNSVLPKYDDQATLDQRWKKEIEEPLEKVEKQEDLQNAATWSLVGLAALGLATIEARFRPVRRGVNAYLDLDRRATAAMDIHPADARQLMGWQAYGQWAGRIPEIGEDSRRDGAPNEENIPTYTLEEIAKGEFMASGQLTREQQRGLKRTAAAMLRSRKLDAKQAKTRNT